MSYPITQEGYQEKCKRVRLRHEQVGTSSSNGRVNEARRVSSDILDVLACGVPLPIPGIAGFDETTDLLRDFHCPGLVL